MTKKERKKISDIADKLPVVYEQTVSGYSVEDGQIISNIQNNPINHTRRMVKAYKKLGLDGIKQYLDYIKSLQQKRHARFRDAQGSSIHDQSDGDTRPVNQEGLYNNKFSENK